MIVQESLPRTHSKDGKTYDAQLTTSTTSLNYTSGSTYGLPDKVTHITHAYDLNECGFVNRIVNHDLLPHVLTGIIK